MDCIVGVTEDSFDGTSVKVGPGVLVGAGAAVGGSGLRAGNKVAVASVVATSSEAAWVGLLSDEQAAAASIKTEKTREPVLFSMGVRLSRAAAS